MSCFGTLSLRAVAFLAVALGFLSTLASALSVSGTVLILARDETSAASAYSGLQGYGIPYEVVIVPSSGAALPTLTSSSTTGNYGAIVVLSEVAYSYDNGFHSALTTEQWEQLYNYQTTFGVRMVRLDVYPTTEFGVTTAIPGVGCCASGIEQLISITNATGFSTAGMKVGAGVSTQGLYHFPAVITNSSIAYEVAQFAAGGLFLTSTTAAVVNQIGKRQQMVWFTGWTTAWSTTSNVLQHAWIHWALRGLYPGFRRVYLSTQIDDMFLPTALYQPSGNTFRVRPADLDSHVTWMKSINSRMSPGSNFFIEVGHNGNGNILAATALAQNGECNPKTAIRYTSSPDTTELEFQKPLGTGIDIWPTTPTSFTWNITCAKLDPLLQWWMTPGNRDAFAHISHTFTHESANNATYADIYKEISWNRVWMRLVGISTASRFSSMGLIPPAITGLHNGDAIKAWADNGIMNVMGDNTRSVLKNTQNPFWPLISTVASNGYDGLAIIPRWATTIYFNCDLPECTTQQWIDVGSGSGDFNNLLDNARSVNTRNLFALRHDPFMFHQANLRQADAPVTTINGVTSQLSLVQAWTETVIQEMVRLVNWPIVTLKQDALALDFYNRMMRDQCGYNLVYNYSTNNKTIVSVTLTATGNTCNSAIPVTFPGPVKSTQGGTPEQLGSDPLTIWRKLSGSAVTYTLVTPIPV